MASWHEKGPAARKKRQIERCYREFKPTQTRKAQRIPFTGRVFVFDNPRLRAIFRRNQRA